MSILLAIFFLCKSGVLINQACQSSNASIGMNSFGLTRMGTISEASETILRFCVPSEN